jgi:hypothetical protein
MALHVNAWMPRSRLRWPKHPNIGVDMLHLQARASEIIARVTGAESGIVTSGAAASLLLGTAACMVGLDVAGAASAVIVPINQQTPSA